MTYIDTRQTRSTIRELLELLGDTDAQRAYERDVPIANVPAELVCMWFDDHYHPGPGWFSEAFSDDERAVLAEFNQFYEGRRQALPMTIGVVGLQSDPVWREIVDRANATLAQLGWSAQES